MTKTETLARGLDRAGWTEIASTSAKYRKFQHPDHPVFMWLGKAGALRLGRIASDTRAATPRLVNHMRMKGLD